MLEDCTRPGKEARGYRPMASALAEAASLDLAGLRTAASFQQAEALIKPKLPGNGATILGKQDASLVQTASRKADADSVPASAAGRDDLGEASVALMP